MSNHCAFLWKLAISFTCVSRNVTSLHQALPRALTKMYKLFTRHVLGPSYLNISHNLLHFFLLTPFLTHWNFSPLKHQAHWRNYVPGTCSPLCMEHPSPRFSQDHFSSSLRYLLKCMSSERPLLSSLAKSALSSHHRPSLAHHSTYPL